METLNSNEDLNDLASAMRDGLADRIKDRSHRLRTYRRCFPGADGVRWLVSAGHAGDEAEATALGNAMLQAGLLHHVAYEHTFKGSGDLLYKFAADDEAGHLRELSRSSTSGGGGLRTALSGLSAYASGACTPVGLSAASAVPQAERANSQLRSVRSVPGPSGLPYHHHAAPSASAGGHHSHSHHQLPHHPGGGHHAHRALLNAQVHGLNLKLERLASQHAALVALNAQQQEAWEAGASADLHDVKESLAAVGALLAPTQRQVEALTGRVGALQAQLASARAVAAMQQTVLALAALALGAGWGPAALWALAAAAAGSLMAALLSWAAEARGEAAKRGDCEASAAAAAAAERLAAAHAAAASKAAAKAAAANADGKDGGLAPTLSIAADASSSSAGAVPPPMSEATRALQARHAIGGKTIDETAPKSSEFDAWPDGAVMMKPSPKSADLAVTRVERYASPCHVAHPTPAHRAWEASQARWAAVAAEADADDAAAAQAAAADAAAAGGWVPAPAAGVPINQYLVHFESDLFVGKMLVYIRGLPSSYEPYFSGKKRRSVLMVQGRFKRPLRVDDVVTGQEFARPYKNLRGCWLMEKIVLAFAKRVVSAMELGDMAAEPYITFPLLALAHVANVSRPGREPPIDQAAEDCRLWDPSLADKSGNPLSADARRRLFMSDKHRRGRAFSTDHVWTFYIWQQVIDVAGYYLDLVVQQYDIIQHLDGQPMQSMVKDKASGQYLFNMLYWNRRQMEETERLRAAGHE